MANRSGPGSRGAEAGGEGGEDSDSTEGGEGEVEAGRQGQILGNQLLAEVHIEQPRTQVGGRRRIFGVRCLYTILMTDVRHL